jgi:mRNA interferase MazF
MSPRPGEVWLADLGLAAKTRPVVIVSRHDPNPPRALVIYVPLTTQKRHSSYEVGLPKFPFLQQESVANIQGLASVPMSRLERKLGRLSSEVMMQIKRAIAFGSNLKSVAKTLRDPGGWRAAPRSVKNRVGRVPFAIFKSFEVWRVGPAQRLQLYCVCLTRENNGSEYAGTNFGHGCGRVRRESRHYLGGI